VLFVGVLFLGTQVDGRAFADALRDAQTALTSYLVYAGLLLILFVEPPIPWFAAEEPVTTDRRPAMLAIGLAIAYVVVLQVPPARDFFQLVAPGPREALLVALSVVAWVLLVRTFWTRKLVDRFLGFA